MTGLACLGLFFGNLFRTKHSNLGQAYLQSNTTNVVILILLFIVFIQYSDYDVIVKHKVDLRSVFHNALSKCQSDLQMYSPLSATLRIFTRTKGTRIMTQFLSKSADMCTAVNAFYIG